ncbi:hypothetical protein [uncultured Porphyromonas sp.]|uniref:hypothetical protein n=1 Tax=uncultured Porphyromonas sp. TaxID=159274 RepID=UPI002635A371|nr:hypothetical protein [uncultured Porphyromonas sp.]
MTRDELYGYLADPKRLSAQTLEPIRQLYESYPYCAPFAFLYLYNLSLTDDVRYPSELRRLSVLLPDRERLFQMVEGERPAFATLPQEEAGEDAFDLIDHFLEGARSSGEDLPDALHFEGASEAMDYFAEEEALSLVGEGLDPLLEPQPASQPALQPQTTEEPAPEELLSETLSKIYIQQQHYDKALRIIRSLSLNYPEKNRFFADQIRFLERLIEHNKSTN